MCASLPVILLDEVLKFLARIRNARLLKARKSE
jgi:recombinational DNA repair ATPase RecF